MCVCVCNMDDELKAKKPETKLPVWKLLQLEFRKIKRNIPETVLGQQKWEGRNILGIIDIEGTGLDDQVEAESDWGDTWKVAARAVMVQLAQTSDVFIITVWTDNFH